MMTYKIESIHIGDKFFRVYKPIDFERKEHDTEFRMYEVSGVFNRSIDLREITPAGRKKTAFRVFLKKGVFEKYDGIYYPAYEIIQGVKEWLKIEVKPDDIELLPSGEKTSTVEYWVKDDQISITYWDDSAVFWRNGKQLTGRYWNVFDLIKGIKESENWKIHE